MDDLGVPLFLETPTSASSILHPRKIKAQMRPVPGRSFGGVEPAGNRRGFPGGLSPCPTASREGDQEVK